MGLSAVSPAAAVHAYLVNLTYGVVSCIFYFRGCLIVRWQGMKPDPESQVAFPPSGTRGIVSMWVNIIHKIKWGIHFLKDEDSPPAGSTLPGDYSS